MECQDKSKYNVNLRVLIYELQLSHWWIVKEISAAKQIKLFTGIYNFIDLF